MALLTMNSAKLTLFGTDLLGTDARDLTLLVIAILQCDWRIPACSGGLGDLR